LCPHPWTPISACAGVLAPLGCAQELPKWTPEEVAAVFASLAEWEETLKEIRTQADAMRENCINFQVRA
jgi:hypothetical protein